MRFKCCLNAICILFAYFKQRIAITIILGIWCNSWNTASNEYYSKLLNVVRKSFQRCKRGQEAKEPWEDSLLCTLYIRKWSSHPDRPIFGRRSILHWFRENFFCKCCKPQKLKGILFFLMLFDGPVKCWDKLSIESNERQRQRGLASNTVAHNFGLSLSTRTTLKSILIVKQLCKQRSWRYSEHIILRLS
jgi:hypothetical protein